MVASAKLHKVQSQTMSMLPYQQKLNAIVDNFLGTEIAFTSPYITDRKVERVAIVALSSNSSLCGAFNSNVMKMFVEIADSYKGLGAENIFVYPVGRKIEEAVKRLGYVPKGSFQKVADKPSYDGISELTATLMQQFTAHAIDKVVLIYHHFKSMGVQLLTHETLLPLNLSSLETKTGGLLLNYIVEPSVQGLIDVLLPQVIHQKMYTVLLDSNTSEHAARTLAMQIATDNADDLVQDLTIQYNKTRQQAITNELLDIIGGSMK
jgi:F-type H+-transporting ATPase subunit gamma